MEGAVACDHPSEDCRWPGSARVANPVDGSLQHISPGSQKCIHPRL